MEKIKFNFEYCYGIKKLQQELVFSNRTFAIYAPNGVMKTSFAKTLKDYSKGERTIDLAFPDRETIREITVDDREISPENIFVIEPNEDKDYKSEKISTLLANKELKQQYEDAHKEIDKAKSSLTKKLKQLSGLTVRKDDIEEIIENIFGENFFDFIAGIEGNISESDSLPFHDVKYQIIFNDKVIKFLETKDFKTSIEKYIETYDEIIEKSPYLGKEFKIHHADNIQKQLEVNNFFKVGHSVNLSDGKSRNEYSTNEELEEILATEKRNVLNNEELQKSYEEIDKKLTNKELKDFRDYLLENQEILPELANLEEFAKKIWMAYFVDQKSLFLDLVTKYKDGQESIKKLIAEAKEEKTDWEEVVRIFNTRFSHLPFHLIIKNREDVILKGEVETIEFVFRDGDDTRVFEGNKDGKKDLLEILSTGEQRALYILNVIFEVEARKKEEHETLFIVDDIADSFDYKNKYAIVEYLKHMSDVEKFRMIILTHNFDFLRTIESRKVTLCHQCLMGVKYKDEIKLESFRQSYIRNPFKKWMKKLDDNATLVASIPFIRNIVEYTQGTKGNASYSLLTSILHYKENTSQLTLNDIKPIFEENIVGVNFPDGNLDQKIIDLIFETAESCLTAGEGINLENKIVLSIAIRLKSEIFMISKITDDLIINSDQTWVLLNKYEEEYNNENVNIEVLKRVVLITPANIHINSFMYEPILDMGDGELRELYKTVRDKLIIEES